MLRSSRDALDLNVPSHDISVIPESAQPPTHDTAAFIQSTPVAEVLGTAHPPNEATAGRVIIPGPAARPAPTLDKVLYEWIQQVHNDTVGHFGVDRTVSKLIKLKSHAPPTVSYKDLRAKVRLFVRQCPVCQLGSQIKPAITTIPYTTASSWPWERLCVDTIGPLPPDVHDNKHVVVFIDAFSRFVELYAVTDTTALTFARCLLELCGRYGAPCQLHSDNGSQFVNEIIEEFLVLLGTTRSLILAYSHEENSFVERANKEVMRQLRAMLLERRAKHRFSELLPLVQRILNSQVHGVLKVSPAQILFGNALHLDRGLLFPPLEAPNQPVTLSDHVRDLVHDQLELIKIAQRNQQAEDLFHLASVDPEEHTVYPINSYVLASYRSRELGSGAPSKLHMPLRGPFQVVARSGDEYTIQDLLTHKTERYHVTQLRPFHYDSAFTDPREVAMKNQGEFLVESILAHEGDRSKPSTMKFKVRWAGYGPEDDTWEPFAELRDNEHLHAYLRANRLVSLIPRKFKKPSAAPTAGDAT